MKKIIFCFLLLCLNSAASFAEIVNRTAADGAELSFDIKDGVPVRAENDWVKILYAGFVVDLKDETQDRTYLEWTFGLEAKYQHIRRIKVYDVSEPPVVLLVDDSNIIFEGKEWFVKLPPVPITREGYPWFFEDNDTALMFRFDLEDSLGRRKSVYQLAIFSVELKKKLIRKI